MTRKLVVNMPEQLFTEMERARKSRADRSAWVQEAVAERLKREQHEADVAAYIRGYEMFPETEDGRGRVAGGSAVRLQKARLSR